MKKKSIKLLKLNKKIVSNFQINSLNGGLSTLYCHGNPLPLTGFDNTCNCDPHTTDPGEMGPCRETVR